MYTKSESTLRQLYPPSTVTRFVVPASNAFNPFVQTVVVNYGPSEEIASGLLPPYMQTFSTEQISFTVDSEFELNEDLVWISEYAYSESDGSRDMFGFGVPRSEGEFVDAALLTRLQDLVASSDPEIAPNFFGDGTGQNESIIEFLYSRGGNTGKSIRESALTYLSGDILDWGSDSVSFVGGGEWRNERLEGIVHAENLFSGIPDPERDIYAAFAELNLPIIREENSLPVIKCLSLKLDARYDRYEMEGVAIEDESVILQPPEQVTFQSLSPRVGVAWQPVNDVRVRGSYSEAFRAPTFSEIFSVNGQTEFPFASDPLSPFPLFGTPTVQGPNPDLKPEKSQIWNLGATFLG